MGLCFGDSYEMWLLTIFHYFQESSQCAATLPQQLCFQAKMAPMWTQRGYYSLCYKKNLSLLTLGSVWSVCRSWRYWQRYQDDVCWHVVLVLSQVQFWTQPAHQGKQTWQDIIQFTLHIWWKLSILPIIETKMYTYVLWNVLVLMIICCLHLFFSVPRVLLLWSVLQGWTNEKAGKVNQVYTFHKCSLVVLVMHM